MITEDSAAAGQIPKYTDRPPLAPVPCDGANPSLPETVLPGITGNQSRICRTSPIKNDSGNQSYSRNSTGFFEYGRKIRACIFSISGVFRIFSEKSGHEKNSGKN
jgi:hypothetical protein